MRPITLYRLGHWCHEHRIPLVPRFLYYLIYVIFNCCIPMSAEIGEGTSMGYGGLGVILHARCRIGRNVIIGPHVVIGGRSGRYEVPVLEDGCFIGVRATILGPVTIGTGAVVGADALVIDDVPPHSVVAGIPAKVIRSNVKAEECG